MSFVNRDGKNCDPPPPGTISLHLRHFRMGRENSDCRLSPVLVQAESGDILASDTPFVAVLDVLGVAPRSYQPSMLGDKCWWTYEPKHLEQIEDLVLEFYPPWDRDEIDFAFVRCAIGASKKFTEAAKEARRRG